MKNYIIEKILEIIEIDKNKIKNSKIFLVKDLFYCFNYS